MSVGCRSSGVFSVEIMTADYYTLLRVPGIGTNSVRRIIKARKHAKLSFTDLKKMGVVLKEHCTLSPVMVV
ncbi:MAG: hypothetical protein ACLRI8_06530 [Agathobacter rectalis]